MKKSTGPDIPTGNTYDKYGSANPIERRLLATFFRALYRALPEGRPHRTLEVGMGEGEVAWRITQRWPGAAVVGVDLPDAELAHSWSKRQLTGVFADVTALPFPDLAFDLVLAIEVLEHIADPDAALAEIRRVGSDRIVLSVPREPIWRAANLVRGKYMRDLGNTPGHVQHWSSRAFTKHVGRHLQVLNVRRPFPWTVVVANR